MQIKIYHLVPKFTIFVSSYSGEKLEMAGDTSR